MIAATLLVSVSGQVDMNSPGGMLADLEAADDEDGSPQAGEGDAGRPTTAGGGSPDDEKDWKYLLQNLTGRQLKVWLQRFSATLEDSLQGQGMEPDRKAMTAIKRFGLYIPQATVYVAGAKVWICAYFFVPIFGVRVRQLQIWGVGSLVPGLNATQIGPTVQLTSLAAMIRSAPSPLHLRLSVLELWQGILHGFRTQLRYH